MSDIEILPITYYWETVHGAGTPCSSYTRKVEDA